MTFQLKTGKHAEFVSRLVHFDSYSHKLLSYMVAKIYGKVFSPALWTSILIINHQLNEHYLWNVSVD